MLKKISVLFMEEDDAIRDSYQEVFDTVEYFSKFTVVFVSDGKEAIKEFKNKKFDCVILDLTVSNDWGAIPTLEGLKKIDPNVRAIVSSGYSQSDEILHPQQYGFVASLPKPYWPHEFKKIIEEVLKKAEA